MTEGQAKPWGESSRFQRADRYRLRTPEPSHDEPIVPDNESHPVATHDKHNAHHEWHDHDRVGHVRRPDDRVAKQEGPCGRDDHAPEPNRAEPEYLPTGHQGEGPAPPTGVMPGGNGGDGIGAPGEGPAHHVAGAVSGSIPNPILRVQGSSAAASARVRLALTAWIAPVR